VSRRSSSTKRPPRALQVPGATEESAVSWRLKGTHAGVMSAEIQVDISKLPVPERQYSADVADLEVDDDFLMFAFGQRTLLARNQPRFPRSVVVVSVPAEAIRRFIASCSSVQFDETLEAFIRRNQIMPQPLTRIVEAPQAVSLNASIIGVAFSGREASMDFYYLSPTYIHRLRSGRPPIVDPVVRVVLRTSLLASLVPRVLELCDELPQEAQ